MSNARLTRQVEEYARVVFDCDGVILDSNWLKSDAFGAALEGEPDERRREFVAWHRANGGISRYVKFAHYFEKMYPVPDAEARARAAIDRYAALVQQGLLSCDELPGLRMLLARLNDAGVPCFVNSGGAENELREVLASRDLAKYFAGIFGSPATKPDNMQRIAEIDSAMPGLFLGDAKSDFDAASGAGFDFVFVSGRSEWESGRDFCAANGLPVAATPGDVAGLGPRTA